LSLRPWDFLRLFRRPRSGLALVAEAQTATVIRQDEPVTETPETDPHVLYRQAIDRLVDSCRDGQGQIGARRARAGLWNRNATETFIPEQHRLNLFLAGLSADDREVLAELLAHEFVSGVHETLVVLHELQIPPFDDGYEGDPFHDFVGRLDDWPWPEQWPWSDQSYR
jgi:hypothetical protein